MVRTSSKRDGLGRQSTVVFAGLGVTIALGIVLQSYLAARLGTSSLADVFYLGTALPTLIATATLGSSSNALIRYATETPKLLDPRRRGTAGRSLLLIATCVSAAVAMVGLLLATGTIGYSSPEFGRQLGRFLLITTPIPVLVATTALASVLALAEQRFVIASWGGAANGAGLLLAVVVFASGGLNSTELGVSVVIGYVCQLAFVTPGWKVVRAEARDVTDLAVARAATFGVLALLGASAIYKSQPLVERLVGSTLDPGVPAALGYADKITSALMQGASFGFAIAALPALSKHFAERDHGEAAERLKAALIGTFTSTLVVATFGLASSRDAVAFLYGRGEFSAEAIALTDRLVLCALPSVLLGALAGPLVAIAYANKQIRDVVRIGLAGFVIGTAGTVVLASIVGPEGIVLGTGCGFGATLFLFARRVPETLPGWSWPSALQESSKVVVLVVGGLAVAFPIAMLIDFGSSDLAMFFSLAVRFVVFAVVGFGALYVARRTEGGTPDGPASGQASPTAPGSVKPAIERSDPRLAVTVNAGPSVPDVPRPRVAEAKRGAVYEGRERRDEMLPASSRLSAWTSRALSDLRAISSEPSLRFVLLAVAGVGILYGMRGLRGSGVTGVALAEEISGYSLGRTGG